ncbi:thymidine phosphorylase [Oscillospiraceae bacterium HV4-5-C5C]|nr:thymidine phosphorylase [Oscillospiraceae bacterium HV4-5-C5C]
MCDLIHLKKSGQALTAADWTWMIEGYVAGRIPDYQMAAFLMAVCFQGMTEAETIALTRQMTGSGDCLDLSSIQGVTSDKHSTGGVGDKTTLVVAPLAAALGLKVAKMSGRSLGHTGGTVDKLESIPGFCSELAPERFEEQVNDIGLAVIAQSGHLVPADKKLYALRDVTDTVDSLPLIASSIMSKKLAAGAATIVLDVKCGNGAFMKDPDQALKLAQLMVRLGQAAGRPVTAFLTAMDRPLGQAVGNAVEVQEAIATLQNQGPADLTRLSIGLAAEMLQLATRLTHPADLASRPAQITDPAWPATPAACLRKAQEALRSGQAWLRFRQMVQAQGGDLAYLDRPERLVGQAQRQTLTAPVDGWFDWIDTEGVGLAAKALGAGRSQLGEALDPAAGIILRAKPGMAVRQGQPLAELLTSSPSRLAEARERLLACCHFVPLASKPDSKPVACTQALPLFIARVSSDGQTETLPAHYPANEVNI